MIGFSVHDRSSLRREFKNNKQSLKSNSKNVFLLHFSMENWPLLKKHENCYIKNWPLFNNKQ